MHLNFSFNYHAGFPPEMNLSGDKNNNNNNNMSFKKLRMLNSASKWLFSFQCFV
jgi:hypothetical protein